MKIDALDIYWVKLPLAFNFRTSYGDQLYTETMLVRMESAGQYAWGESCPPYVPSYSAEHTTGTFHTLRALMAPRIIGQEIASAQDLLDRLAFIKGNQFARAALEITWWVLDAKRRGLPLHRALGGSRDRVAVGADFGVQDSLDMLMEKIQGAVDAGFPRIKLKFRPGWDLSMVEAVRSTFPDFTFHIDCPVNTYDQDVTGPNTLTWPIAQSESRSAHGVVHCPTNTLPKPPCRPAAELRDETVTDCVSSRSRGAFCSIWNQAVRPPDTAPHTRPTTRHNGIATSGGHPQ